MSKVTRVDPDALEAEADRMMEQVQEILKGKQTPAEPAQADTSALQTEPAPAQQDTPKASESSDSTAQPPPEKPEAGEVEEKLRLADERVKNAQARMTKATQEAAELRREMSELRLKLTELESKKSEPDDDEVKRLETDYPDIAKPLLAKIASLESRLTEQARSTKETGEQAKIDAHFRAIRDKHPDLDEVTTTEAWNDWLAMQTATWQKIAGSGTADEVVELVDRYKGRPTQQTLRGADKAKAVAEPQLPRSRPQQETGKRIWTAAEVKALSTREYERLEAEIDQAIAEGRYR